MIDGHYITDADKAEYRRFVMHHLPAFGRPAVKEVWHYTTAAGLIAILTDGKLFSTQITCLNDSLEQRFFGDLVHAGLKKLITSNKDPKLAVLLQTADIALSNRDFSSAWHFVTCFSDVADDLGQWRGYGGGQCGYAIGFDTDKLTTAMDKARPGSLFLPMNYDPARHQFLVDDVLKNAQIYFAVGAQKHSNLQQWADEFLAAFAWELDIFACMTKHPSFAGEKERRIVTALGPGETSQLEFRQKQTLLARHLPIDLRAGALLPITQICIGPGPAQRVSQVSVGDLLVKNGYSGLPVTFSSVPFRIV